MLVCQESQLFYTSMLEINFFTLLCHLLYGMGQIYCMVLNEESIVIYVRMTLTQVYQESNLFLR